MKIAYLVNQYPQPSLTFIRREIGALEALGNEIHRFTVRRWEGELVDPVDLRERQSTRAILESGRITTLWHIMRSLARHPIYFAGALAMALRLGRDGERGMAYHLVYLAEACVLAGWLERLGVDHLHAHFGTNSASVALLCHMLCGIRWSFTTHGSEEFDKPAAIHLAEKIEQASFVVAISDFCRAQLLRWVEHDQWSKIHIIHCGLDDAFLHCPAEPVAAARLVYVGRLGEQKGLRILLEAAGRLAGEGVEFHLVLVGDGPMRPDIERLIDRLNLRGKVELAGWMSGLQVRDAILQSRALVLPSFAEGLPVVIMEALALGRAVIATQVGGIAELVEAGRTGWLIPPGSEPELARAMREALAASPEQLRRMGQCGAAVVAQRHDARAEARRLGELFASMRRQGGTEGDG